jgi:DNA-binding MarR family transcriptional regulator
MWQYRRSMTRKPLPSRLPPEGTRNVFFQSFRTGLAMRELTKSAVDGTGVSGEEYGVLGVVYFFPDRTPTELASALGIPPTTVSRHVARFLGDGLVERRENPHDGRSYLLRATPRGSKIVETIAPRLTKLVDELAEVSEQPLPEIAASLVALENAAKRVLEKNLLPDGSI